MLQIKNISKSFGGVRALNACSFTIPAQHITALIGPNGAGKTTLFDCISGLLKPDRGSITLESDIKKTALTKKRPDVIANLGISRTFQQVRIFEHLTIYDHLQLAQDNLDIHLWKNIFAQHNLDHASAKEYLSRFHIPRPITTYVSDLSYGQRKLLQIAMALLKPHKLLLLDEPIAGVNAVVQKEIEALLLSFKASGETILIIEHDMEFITRLADYVVVMDEGSVLAEGTPEKVLKNKKVLEAYLGE